MKATVKSYLLITLGAILIGLGLYFFEFTNKFTTGGVGGISIVLGQIAPYISSAGWFFVLNLILTTIGFIIFGKQFGIKTVYCSLLLSALTYLLEFLFPLSEPLTDQKTLEMFLDVLLISIGSALIFNEESSSGGSDIVAMIIKKYIGINIGVSLMIVDFFVVCVSFAAFGIETALYSLFILVLRTLVLDNAMESLNTSKYFVIVTDKADKICCYINDDLGRGATIMPNSYGAFTNEKKTIVMTVVGRREAVRLRHKIKRIDENAFCIICTSSEIIGRGFKTAQ